MARNKVKIIKVVMGGKSMRDILTLVMEKKS